MTAIFRMLVFLGGCAVLLNPRVGTAAPGLQSAADPSEPPSVRRSTTATLSDFAQISGFGGWSNPARSDRTALRHVQYVAPSPGYPPGQYYAPGLGYPGNYAPVPPPQFYAPPYYERRFYSPPVYVQPYRSNRFCARYPWRCE